jgi:hypothetical protein
VSVIVLWDKGKWKTGAFILAFTVLKLNLGGLILLFVGLWLISQKRWLTLFTIAISCFLILGIGWINNPSWINYFLHANSGQLAGYFGHLPTIWGLSGLICKSNLNCIMSLGGVLAALFFLGGSYLLIQKNTPLSPGDIITISTTLMLLITPYTGGVYDQILLIIPILRAIDKLAQARVPFLVSATIFPWIGLEAFGLLNISLYMQEEGWSGLLPLTCFLLSIWSIKVIEHIKSKKQLIITEYL